jgi:hypothetical protein
MGGAKLVVIALIALAGAVTLLHGASASNDSGGVAGGGPDFTGVYDLLINDYDETEGFFHCILALDHNTTTNEIAGSSQCYPDVDLDDPNAEPPAPPPGEGPDLLAGPKPPPPYAWQAPMTGGGTYTPDSPGPEKIELAGCIRGLGGSLGPNTIVEMNFQVPTSYFNLFGYAGGQIHFYAGQGSVACDSLTPQGPFDDMWQTYLYPVNDVNGAGTNHPAAWRTLGDDDWDDDGCTDSDELHETSNCGDDPFSGLDLGPPGTDVSGDYVLVATVAEADVCWGGTYGSPPVSCSGPDDSLVGGEYYMCYLDVQQSGTALTARTYCYIDSPSIAVNPQVAGAKTCPPADAQYCGDGLVGAAPPGRTVSVTGKINFGDINDQHDILAGQLSGEALTLAGCLADRDGAAAPGNVYLTGEPDIDTGRGILLVYEQQTTQNCIGGTPSGIPKTAGLALARQALTSQQRDTDSDGCPDRRELSDTKTLGGLRDPFNRFDYMNPSGDGVNRVDDILSVVGEYFDDDPPGNIDYGSKTDRTAIGFSNEWNLGPPNGQQRVDDILNIVKQYFHDC